MDSTIEGMTPRELVRRALTFQPTPRIPRNPWTLPWAEIHYPTELAVIRRDFPDDFLSPDPQFPRLEHMRGEAWHEGICVDEWGCRFVNLQEGVIGEVKDPLIADYASDLDKLRPPDEWLTFDIGLVNRQCAETDRFTLANAGLVRPFERMQFLRGTVNLYMDLMDQPAGLLRMRDRVHEWNLAMIDRWLRTDVDAMGFMDDWGTQTALLISPALWRAFFKPMYQAYVQRIHQAGKFCFFHSDGYISEIYGDLVEIGIDAINSQLFCMDIEQLGRLFKGRVTIWGEIDRQQILPRASVDQVRQAVRRLASAFYDGHGGVIAECEFGPGAKPENIRAVYDEWDRVGHTAGG